MITVGDTVRVCLPGVPKIHNQTGVVCTEPTDTGRMIVELSDGEGYWLYTDQVEKENK